MIDVIVSLVAILLLLAGPTQEGGRLKGGPGPQRSGALEDSRVLDSERKTRTADSKSRSSKAERLERWRSLEPEVRAGLKKRYEALQSLSPEDRAKLMERAERLQREIDRTLATLGPEERTAIEALEPRERARVLRGLVGDRARMAGSRLRGRMTKEQREKLESASPAEREALLRAVREQDRARMPEQLGRLGRELGLADGELRRIERGTAEDRRQVMIDVARRRSKKHVEENGLPEGVPERRWRSIAAGSDEEFVRGYLRIRARHPEFGVSPKRWEQRSRRGDAMARKLDAFAQPTMQQRMRFADASESQLRRRVLLEQRSRVEEALVRMGGLSRDEAARLRSLDDDDFARTYRGATSALRRGGELKPALQRSSEGRDRTGRRRGGQRR